MKNIEQYPVLTVGETPEDILIEKQICDILNKAKEKLKSEHRDMADMFYWDGLSCITIAQLFGRTPGSVRVTLTNIRKKLRTELGKNINQNWIREIFS
jgi:RNA polymerase sigma factor (sigma-70 family)